MYIDYINVTLNANNEKVRKPPVVLDLKVVFDKMVKKTLPYGSEADGLTITQVQACANSKGCAPKGANGRKDYLTAVADVSGVIRTARANTASAYVVLMVSGTYRINGISEKVHIRVPRSGVIGVRMGLRKQTKFRLNNDRVDASLQRFISEITTNVMEVIPGAEKIRPSKLVALSVKGLNMFNPTTGERPPHRIKNFINLMKSLDEKIETHVLDYSQRNGVQIARGNLKPIVTGTDATIGITPWGMVDFMGGTTVSRILELVSELDAALKKTVVRFDETTTFKPQHVTKQCSDRNPLPLNDTGKCMEGMLARPRKGGLCCYKMKHTPAVERKLVQEYNDANMELPSHLKNLFRNTNTGTKQNSSIKLSVKSKPDVTPLTLAKCMMLSKPQLVKLATKMQVNPMGFKADLCERIISKQKTLHNNKVKRVSWMYRKLMARALNK